MSSQLAPSSSLAPSRAALPLGLPDATALFAFAAEAERRVATLRLRIKERGARFTIFDVDPITARSWAQKMLDWAAPLAVPGGSATAGSSAEDSR